MDSVDRTVIEIMDIKRDLAWLRCLAARERRMTMLAGVASFMSAAGFWLLLCSLAAIVAGLGAGPYATKAVALVLIGGEVGKVLYAGRAMRAQQELASAKVKVSERNHSDLAAGPDEDDEPGGDIDWGDGGPLGAR